MVYKYVKRTSKKAKKTPGKSYVARGKTPKLGTGERFKALKTALKKKGAKDPRALAAFIGRKKLGKTKFQRLAAAGKKKAK